jgi:hypothetical protein
MNGDVRLGMPRHRAAVSDAGQAVEPQHGDRVQYRLHLLPPPVESGIGHAQRLAGQNRVEAKSVWQLP